MGFYRDANDGPDHETEGTTLDYNAEAKQGPTEYRPPFWAAKYKSEGAARLRLQERAGAFLDVVSLSTRTPHGRGARRTCG
jgi:hypothetical protein